MIITIIICKCSSSLILNSFCFAHSSFLCPLRTKTDPFTLKPQPEPEQGSQTLTRNGLRLVAARCSTPYWSCGLKSEGAAEPGYGAKAEPEEERLSCSVLRPSTSPGLRAGHAGRAKEAGGWNRNP